MAEAKGLDNNCIMRGYASTAAAEPCLKQLGSNYEVKMVMQAVRRGMVVYQVQPKPTSAGFFATLMSFLNRF